MSTGAHRQEMGLEHLGRVAYGHINGSTYYFPIHRYAIRNSAAVARSRCGSGRHRWKIRINVKKREDDAQSLTI